MNGVHRNGWRRVRTLAIGGTVVVVLSVAISSVAIAALGDSPSVTLCVNNQHSVRVLGATASCASGEQAVKVFTTAGANARFALKSKPHTLDAYEKVATCTSGTNGTGVGRVDASKCDDYGNVDLTGDTIGTSIGTYVLVTGNIFQASLTFHLSGGDITAAGFYDATDATDETSHFEITGGSGAYAGAKGTIASSFENGGAAYHYAMTYRT
jgi:hypothetical protein